MKKTLYGICCLVTLSVSSPAQYFSKLYDADSSIDWGTDIFVEPDDNSFFVLARGWRGTHGIIAAKISQDGNTKKSEKITRAPYGHFLTGIYGKAKRLVGGNYAVPMTFGWPVNGTDHRWSSGLALLNSVGDTLLTRLYNTDTVNIIEDVNGCFPMPGGGFLLTGSRRPYGEKDINKKWGLLLRVDNAGNKLWERVYPYIISDIVSAELYGDQILAGAYKSHLIYNNGMGMYVNRPVFLLMDSTNGVVVKDTTYYWKYANSGGIFNDKNGGFFNFGAIDTVARSGWDYDSYSSYFARIDEQFRVTWQRKLSHDAEHVHLANAIQLSDGSYLLMGLVWGALNKYKEQGWAAQIDKDGNMLWENSYTVNADYMCGLADGAEMPDGGFVFTGHGFSYYDQKNTGHDYWVLRVDDRGCLVPGCTPTGLNEREEYHDAAIYPNPTTGSFTFTTPRNGALTLYDALGRKVVDYYITQRSTAIKLPATLSPGVYTCRLVEDNGAVTTQRVVYQP